MSSEQEFQGKTALVTGASSGIGAETAVAFARRGAYVLMHYNSSRAGADEAFARVRAAGGDGLLLKADLGEEPGIDDFVRQLRETGRPVDFLINNAGSLVARAKFLDITPALWHRVITLNWTSALRISPDRSPDSVLPPGNSYPHTTGLAADSKTRSLPLSNAMEPRTVSPPPSVCSDAVRRFPSFVVSP